MKNGLIVDSKGNRFWYLNGVYHREDSHAVEWNNGTKAYCLFGACLLEEDFLNLKRNESCQI